MADLVIVPTSDGHMDFTNNTVTRNEPQTNSRIREFLKKSGSALDSGSSSDDQQRQLANHSPPPNCSICLGRIKSKCFTDSCMHQFCFSCLLEWSKVKPECPLCKQTFKSIIHNVTSIDSFEEYKVEARQLEQRHVNWINIPFQPGDVDMNLLFSASLPNYQIHRPDHLNRSSVGTTSQRLYQLFRHDSPLIQRFAQTYPDEIYPNRISGTQWRNYIYNRRLYAEPLNDLSGHSRDISAEFYRANPAQIHRLVPWLHRELTCLASDQPQPVNILVQRIETLIQTYDMTTFDFQSRIRAFISNHTDHFIHELINYARSPYDLIGYDRFVTYLPRFESDTNDVVTVSSSEEGSDVEFVGPIVNVVTVESADDTSTSNQNASSNGNENRSNNSSFSSNNRTDSIEQAGASTSGTTTVPLAAESNTLNVSGDDSDEEEIKTYLQRKPNVSADEVIRGRTGPSPQNAEPANLREQNGSRSGSGSANTDFDSERTIILPPRIPHSSEASTSQIIDTQSTQIIPKVEPNTQTTQEIIDADNGSDSDECLFVCAKKPPHLRTPEYVELNSDSDSDVVFVSEACQPTMPDISPNHLDAAAANVRKSILNAIQMTAAQCTETSTNYRRKRARTTDTNSSTFTSQNASSSLYESKPSTSEAMLHWLIQPNDEHSRRISPRSSTQQRTPPIRPRLTTTIKISRGKRIYESSSSDSDREDTTDPDSSVSSSSNSCTSSDVESSSHEEFVCSSGRPRTKRPANNDGPSLTPRKRFRKRRGKRIFDTSSSDGSDGDE